MTAIAAGTKVMLALHRPLMRWAVRRVLVGRRLDPLGLDPARWTRADADRFVAGVWRRLPRLVGQARLADLPTWGSRHNVLLAVVTSAVYQQLRARGLGRDVAAEWVGDVGWPVYARGLRLVGGAVRWTSRDPEVRMARALRALMVFPFSAPGRPGYEVEVWADEDGFHTHWTWCPPQAFVRDLVEAQGDDGELEAFRRSWCGYDWPGADVLARDGRRGHYERTRTLSAGDPVCDMCWRGRGRAQRPEIGRARPVETPALSRDPTPIFRGRLAPEGDSFPRGPFP